MKQKKYISGYSNNKEVSPAQYIAEIICEMKAKKFNKDLHYRFWTNKEWASFYRNQIGTANLLLIKYSDVAIVRALRNTKAKGIYSLRAPHLEPIIQYEQHIVDTTNTDLTVVLDRVVQHEFRKENKKNNLLSKLKDIDDNTK